MDQLPGPTQKRKHLALFNAVLRYRTSNAQYSFLYIHHAPYVLGIQTVSLLSLYFYGAKQKLRKGL